MSYEEESSRTMADDGVDSPAARAVKVTDTTYFFRRNRDIGTGTISVYLGYFYVHCVSLYLYIW